MEISWIIAIAINTKQWDHYISHASKSFHAKTEDLCNILYAVQRDPLIQILYYKVTTVVTANPFNKNYNCILLINIWKGQEIKDK